MFSQLITTHWCHRQQQIETKVTNDWAKVKFASAKLRGQGKALVSISWCRPLQESDIGCPLWLYTQKVILTLSTASSSTFCIQQWGHPQHNIARSPFYTQRNTARSSSLSIEHCHPHLESCEVILFLYIARSPSLFLLSEVISPCTLQGQPHLVYSEVTLTFLTQWSHPHLVQSEHFLNLYTAMSFSLSNSEVFSFISEQRDQPDLVYREVTLTFFYSA